MKNRELYITGVKHVNLTVFNIDDDTKTYYDPIHNKSLPFSSGQQIKRCFMDNIRKKYYDIFDFSTMEMRYNITKDSIEQKEALSSADNTCIDQMIGGYMRARKKDNENNKKGDETNTITRRSPISFSPMTPVHPDLVSLTSNHLSTMDRTDRPNDSIYFTKNNKEVDQEKILRYLDETNSFISKRKTYYEHKKVSGLFKFDMAIDLERLFRVSIKKYDPEVYPSAIKKLKDLGWKKVIIRGEEYLELPKEQHEKYAESIAESLIEFRINSNQSRTLDFMPTISIAVSDNPQLIPMVYRRKIDGDNNNKLFIDNSSDEIKTFNTPLIEDYVVNYNELNYNMNSLNEFKKEIKKKILNYYS